MTTLTTTEDTMTHTGEAIGNCKHCGMEMRLTNGACFDCISRAERYAETATFEEIIDLEIRVKDLEARFRHMHVNNGVDDACKTCGFDLRDLIHERVKTP